MDPGGPVDLRGARSRSRPPVVVPLIRRCGAELAVNLAVSLHAVRDDIRDRLVPLNRKYPIAELLDACRNLSRLKQTRGRYYLRIRHAEGRQTTVRPNARELVRLLAGIPAKVNLIPFQPVAGRALRVLSGGDDRGVLRQSSSPPATRRRCETPRGRDIPLPPAASSNRRASSCAGAMRYHFPPPDPPAPARLACCTRCSDLGSSPMRRCSAACFFFQRQLLYFPDKTRPRSRRAGAARRFARVVLSTEDGLSLLSWYLPGRPGPAGHPLFSRQTGGHIGHRVERMLRFAREGYGVADAGVPRLRQQPRHADRDRLQTPTHGRHWVFLGRERGWHRTDWSSMASRSARGFAVELGRRGTRSPGVILEAALHQRRRGRANVISPIFRPPDW